MISELPSLFVRAQNPHFSLTPHSISKPHLSPSPFFSFSWPCFLTSIISHHPFCSLDVISSDIAVIIMYCIDFSPSRSLNILHSTLEKTIPYTPKCTEFNFSYVGSANYLFQELKVVRATVRHKGNLNEHVCYSSLIFIIFPSLLQVVSCLHRWGHQLSAGPTSWPDEPLRGHLRRWLLCLLVIVKLRPAKTQQPRINTLMHK